MFTYTLAGGNDVARLNLDSASGVLTFGSAPDFEAKNEAKNEAKGDANGDNVYEVTLQVADGQGGNDTLTGGSGNDVFVFRPGFGSDDLTALRAERTPSPGPRRAVRARMRSRCPTSRPHIGDPRPHS